MATIQVNDNYRIKSDEHQWRVEQRIAAIDKKTNERLWRALSYHAEIDQAANSLRGYLLRKSDANGIDAVAAELKRINDEVSRAISSRIAA